MSERNIGRYVKELKSRRAEYILQKNWIINSRLKEGGGQCGATPGPLPLSMNHRVEEWSPTTLHAIIQVCPIRGLTVWYLFSFKKVSTIVRYTFSSNRNIHKSSCGLCFWAPDPLINRFYYWLNGLEPKNKGHTNFYECCNLTKKYI